MNPIVEEFSEFLDELREKSEEETIIVEGIKDKKALAELGIKSIPLLRRPLYKVVELVVKKGKNCIILTDLDKEGKMLYSKLNAQLSQMGIRIDNKPREFLFKTKLRQIEGIKSYFENIE
jgi:5S rRNA maturation endonuclease (ribonuclease M5)